jgi:hypothetical protein
MSETGIVLGKYRDELPEPSAVRSKHDYRGWGAFSRANLEDSFPGRAPIWYPNASAFSIQDAKLRSRFAVETRDYDHVTVRVPQPYLPVVRPGVNVRLQNDLSV